MGQSVIKGFEFEGDYVHIGNNHIFVNLFTGTKERLYDIHDFIDKTGDMNQHIHIFVSAILDMDDFIKHIAVNDPRAKTIIHIPRRLADYKRMIEYHYKKYLLDNECIFDADADVSKVSWVKIIVESKGPSFKFPRGSVARAKYGQVDAVYTRDSIILSIPIVNHSYDPEYNVKYLNNHSSQAAIQTKFQKDNMEMFKDVIIKNFRRVCPSGILKTLNTTDKIWEYITAEGEWSWEDELESKNADLAQQMKDMSPETLQQKNLKIMRNAQYGAGGIGSSKVITAEEAEQIKRIQERLKVVRPDE